MRGLRIGYSDSWEPLRYETRKGFFGRQPGESSGILIGPPRSGKSDFIEPWLFEYEGSVICIDPKGQNCCITGAHRRKRLRQNVIALNPFNVWPDYIGNGKIPHSGFNPLISVSPGLAFGNDCDALAEAIVVGKPGDRESHWTDSARQLVSGVLMCIARDAPPERRSLVTLYEIISGPQFFEFAQEAVLKGDALVRGRLGRFAAPGASENKELVSILSTAITNCNFIGNDCIMKSLAGAAKGEPVLRWRDHRKRPSTTYVILPVRYLSSCARWLRLVVASCLNDLLVEEKKGVPILLLIDEAAALGHMQIIEDCMALAAGMGVTMIPVFQDACQIKDIYQDRMQSWLGVAGFQIYLAPRESFTAGLISDLSGVTEVIVNSKSVTIDPRTGDPNVTVGGSPQARKLLLPDEVMAIGPSEALVRVENIPDMIRCKRRRYFASREFKGLCGRDPYHE